MCGRYTLKSLAEIIAETFGVQEKPGSHERELVALQWGLVPFWADDPEISSRMANARSESAAAKPAFRSSYRARRCLIVADGFYVWQACDGKKQPYYIRLKSGQPFGIGGLWDRWDKQGEPVESCTILTCDANEPMMATHERMPVVEPLART